MQNSNIDGPHVAVIGAGPAGLAALKCLQEEGFRVTGFERRSEPGGVWAFSDNPEYTSVTEGTTSQLWLRWVHDMAGTGLFEHLGWTWKGVVFFLRHPRLYLTLAYGVNSPHIIRFFETGKRKVWDGALEAILQANRMSKKDLEETKIKSG